MTHNDPKALYLSQLRDKDTGPAAFRKAAHQLTHLLAYEALSHLDTKSYTLKHPLIAQPALRFHIRSRWCPSCARAFPCCRLF